MIFIELLQLLSCLSLGLLAGSLLTEGMILVPYWRTMEPTEFLRLHSTLGPKLFSYFAPLTILATFIPVLAAVIPILLGTAWHWMSIALGVITLIMLGIYFGYFKGANDSFKSGSVGSDRLAKELSRWAKWHWLRIILSLIAFVISLLVLSYNL